MQRVKSREMKGEGEEQRKGESSDAATPACTPDPALAAPPKRVNQGERRRWRPPK